MSVTDAFQGRFTQCPLVAILRGLTPEEADGIGDSLVESGFTLIEVPLNSPRPFDSIERLARRFEGRALIGAGTVLSVEDVQRVIDAGGQLVVSPNADCEVIAMTVARKRVSLPGVATLTEAFAALKAGATALKLFPAEGMDPAVLKAWLAVLPAGVRVLPVGGITPDGMRQWQAAGAAGFGLGSALYKPGMGPGDVRERALRFVAAARQLQT